MKQIWNSFRLAFSMYSIFPARSVEKNRENMKYVLVFVPVIGIIIGFLITQWQVVSPYLLNRDLLGAVVCVIMPVFLSGGAFLDGFFRTVDALCSHQPREGKLEILRDSHSGYSATIICVCYFFIVVGIWSELPLDTWPVLAYGFVLSRALYGLSIVLFKHSQESKSTPFVQEGRTKTIIVISQLLFIVIAAAGMLSADPMVGAYCLAGALLAFLYYSYTAFKHFGGITEDIASFFVHVCEIAMPLLVLVMGILTNLDIGG